VKAFSTDDLERIYRAVALAGTSGGFSSGHGPLDDGLAASGCSDLERIDEAGGAVLTGNDGALAPIRGLAMAVADLPARLGRASAVAVQDRLRLRSTRGGEAPPLRLRASRGGS
jgi:hypothetical protein